MPKVRWEKTGTTHHGFSDKNFEKELARLESKFEVPKLNAMEVNRMILGVIIGAVAMIILSHIPILGPITFQK